MSSNVVFLSLLVFFCYCTTFTVSQIALSLGSMSLANNSEVVITDIGDSRIAGTSPLVCNTTYRPCCASSSNRHGDWYYPNGTLVGNFNAGQNFYRGRSDDGEVLLNRKGNISTSPLGVYFCILPINNDLDVQRVAVTVIAPLMEAPSTEVTTQTPPTLITAMISVAGTPTVGESYSLTCTVTGADELNPTITYQWFKDNTVILAATQSTLFIASLRLSYAGQYRCDVTVNYSVSPITAMRDLILQVPPPIAVSVTTSPDDTIFTGCSLYLTCSIELNEAVKHIPVTVNTMWSGPPGTQFTTTTSVATMINDTTYNSVATINSVTTSYSGEYTCRASVSSTPSFLIDSDDLQGSTSVNVATLSVYITSHGNNTMGKVYQLTCRAIIIGGLSAIPPSFQWTGPPNDMVISAATSSSSDSRMILPGDDNFTSVLQFNPLRITHEGRYTCEIVVGPARETNSTIVTVNVLPPSSPTMVSITPRSTSITITWTQPVVDIVDNYEISYSYQGPCTDDVIPPIMITTDNGTIRSHTGTGLEEFSDYQISITAINNVGRSDSANTMTRTMSAAPAGRPQSLVNTFTTLANITIQWNPVICVDRNSDIIQYRIRYGLSSTTDRESMTIDATFTVVGLIPRTAYTFEVEALNDVMLAGPAASITITTSAPERVGFLLNGILYGNNSIVTLNEISEDNAALYCLTNNTDCCRSSDTPAGVGGIGEWFFPNGSSVRNEGTGDDIYRGRGPSVVLLHSKNNAQTTGIFCCEVPDASGTNQQLYIGVYPMNSGSPSITDLSYNQSTLTLTCTSTGGPATNVTWRKNGVVVEGGDQHFQQSSRLVNTITATYENVLSSADIANFVGSFTCRVSNSRGDIERSSTLNGVTIRSGIFIVGMSATLECICDAPASMIQWLDNENRVVAMATTMDRLDLRFNPVNDSIHNSVYTCRVTRGEETAEQHIAINVIVLVQIRLVGVRNCDSWTTSSLSEKAADVVSSLVNNIEQHCGCGFTASQIQKGGFQCFPDSEDAVTYRAELSGNSRISVSWLVSIIEEWITEDGGAGVLVQSLVVRIDGSCAVMISSIVETECQPQPILVSTTPSSSGDSDTAAIVGGIAAVVVVLILAITMTTIVALVLRNKRDSLKLYGRTKRQKPPSAVGLSAVSQTKDYEEMSHEYEDIDLGKYGQTYEEIKQPQVKQPQGSSEATSTGDYELSQCPAYGVTTAIRAQPAPRVAVSETVIN